MSKTDPCDMEDLRRQFGEVRECDPVGDCSECDQGFPDSCMRLAERLSLLIVSKDSHDTALSTARREAAQQMRDRCEAKAREVASGSYGSIAGDAIRDLPLE